MLGLMLEFCLSLILFLYLLIRRDYRREIEKNFYQIFRKREKSFWRRNAQRLGRNFALMLNPTPLYPSLLDKNQFIRENINMGNGMIFLTLHFGLWEILPTLFRSSGYPVAIAVSRQRNPFFERFLLSFRRRKGIKILSNIPDMIQCLKEGYLLGFACDNTQRTKRVYLPEIGASIIKTPFLLAKRTKLPLYAILSKEDNCQLVIMMERITTERDFARFAVEFIKRYPEDWIFWGKG